MGKKVNYNEILVVDLEATCWEQNKKPQNQQQEIIEIGVCVFNTKSLRIYDKTSIIIKPEKSTISDYCFNLTGLSQSDVDDGVSLKEAASFLREECRSHKRPWASWGDWDRRILELECKNKNVPFPMTSRHINIKVLFPVVFSLKNDCGMEKALDILNLELEGCHHRGSDDAWNTAKILGECIRGGPLPTKIS